MYELPKLVAFENLFAKLEALWWLPFSRSELEMFCIEIERPEAASEARRGAALPIRLQNQLLIKSISTGHQLTILSHLCKWKV